MEQDIRAGKYLENGDFEGNLYGTKVDSIRDIMRSGKMCILDVNPTVSVCSSGKNVSEVTKDAFFGYFRTGEEQRKHGICFFQRTHTGKHGGGGGVGGGGGCGCAVVIVMVILVIIVIATSIIMGKKQKK